jgi:LPXTG-site transpeptidase (sortase) family protein
MTEAASSERRRTRIARAAFGIAPFALAALLLLSAGGIRHAASLASLGSASSSASGAVLPPVVATPKRLLIPTLKIDVPLESVGLNENAEMDVPSNPDIPGWYRGGVRPGEKGNAVIAGHKDTQLLTPAVFAELGALKAGDEIFVEDLSGNVHRFNVTRIAEYDALRSPMSEIFGPNEKPTLQLITCSGPWDKGRGGYEKRLVVYTELMP